MIMWTVSFQEYLQFNGVKEGIRNMKYTVKEQRKDMINKQFGMLVEEGISKIITDFPAFEVKHLNPQMDIGFGADLQVSYKEGDKNYSFFVDITTKRKDQIQYLTISGETTNDIEEAFCYNTEYFRIRFGLKEKHGCHFFYEKPVVVVYIENYIPTTGLAIHHINNIGHFMISLNSLLVNMGFGARASQKVRPNIKRFREDYEKSLKK